MSSAANPSITSRAPQVSFMTFDVAVARIERMGDSFVRITFQGDSLEHFHFAGLDQRIKLVLPNGTAGVSSFPRDTDDWYSAWRNTPEEDRCVLRTYTVRASRPELREIDVDFVVHGVSGPATRWVSEAVVGSELLVIGPDVRSLDPEDDRVVGGVEFAPGTARRILLAGDETAAPAICSILEALPRKSRGQVFIEVPTAADILPTAAPGGVTVCWLPRDTRPGLEHGQVLDRAVRAWTSEMMPATNSVDDAATPGELADVDVDRDILWDVPAAADVETHELYAWLAGEAACIKELRRFLVRDTGLHRSDVAFMGYWRLGRAEN